MSDEEILTAAQRSDIAAFAGVQADALDDEALLTAAAEKIGLEGELAVDPDGMVELSRGSVLAILEAVGEEDATYVDHPEQLHLAVYLRPESDAERRTMEEANLLEGSHEPDMHEADGWVYAWWGSMCTNLPADAPLSRQMETLERVLAEAETALEEGAPDRFLEATRWLEYEA